PPPPPPPSPYTTLFRSTDATAPRANPEPGGAEHLCLQAAYVAQDPGRCRFSGDGAETLGPGAEPQNVRVGEDRVSRRRVPPPRRARSFAPDPANGRALVVRAPCAHEPRRESSCRLPALPSRFLPRPRSRRPGPTLSRASVPAGQFAAPFRSPLRRRCTAGP